MVSDPDGDPLEARSVTGHHLGDGGATFEVTDFGDRVAFAMALPYSQPSDADFLIGGEGLERTIAFAMRDVNGAETSEIWPVVIANRPPELVLPLVADGVDEPRVRPGRLAGVPRRREAERVAGSGWRPDDRRRSFTGDAACAELHARRIRPDERSSAAWPRAMAAVAGNFVGAHDIQERVRDPWAASPDAAVSSPVRDPQPSARRRGRSHDSACDLRRDRDLLRLGGRLLHGQQVEDLRRSTERSRTSSSIPTEIPCT